LGRTSGSFNSDGSNNTFVGASAGYYNTSGNQNVALGRLAGINSQGDGNVFLGFAAGYNESGANKLYIDNSGADPNNALVYGEFDTGVIRLNATAHIRDAMVLEPRATPPASPVVGTMYIDSSDSNKLKVWDGTAWQACW
jgi:hypothetical protein